jgi:molecular chaperone DnaK (HSP70)
VNPDEAMAYGAAVQASIISGNVDENTESMIILFFFFEVNDRRSSAGISLEERKTVQRIQGKTSKEKKGET